MSDSDDYYIDDPYDKPTGGARGGGGGANKKKPTPKPQQPPQPAAAAAASGGSKAKSPQNRSPTLAGQSGKGAAAVPSIAGATLTPADKILARMRWDDVLSPILHEIDIIYEDRFAGRMSIPVSRFRTADGSPCEGDQIPWHRVYQYVYKGRVIWDREQRLDVVDTLVDEIRAQQEAAEAAEDQVAVSGVLSLRHLGGERLKIVLPPNAKQLHEAAEVEAAAAAGGDGASSATPSKKHAHHVANLVQPLKKGQPLKVVTYNILHDLFDADAVYTDARLPLIAKELEAQKADVLFLQEVTLPRFRDLLQISSYLRNTFYWTYLPNGVNTVQVTGSRFPLSEAFAENISRNKRRIYALMHNPWPANGNVYTAEAKSLPVLLVNCHFLSDHGGGATNRRLGEITQINKNLAGFPRVILAGDFNYGDQNQESSVPYDNLYDAWIVDFKAKNGLTELPPQEDNIVAGQVPKQLSPIGGFTFDITRNPLANLSCEHHRYPRRLDRIMFRAFTVVGNSCAVFATNPYPVSAVPKACVDLCASAGAPVPDDGKVYPSDHFGVAVELLMDEDAYVNGAKSTGGVNGSSIAAAAASSSSSASASAAAAPPAFAAPSPLPLVADPVIAAMGKAGAFTKFFRSALVFLPPQQLFDKINRFRGNNRDKAFPRWMPHTTILFPFVHPDQFPAAINLITTALQSGTWFTQRPFRVRVAKTGEFRRGTAPKAVVFLQPECVDAKERSSLGVEPMRRVFDPLQRLFPTCGRDDEEAGTSPAAGSAASSGAAAAAAAASSASSGLSEAARSYSPHFTLGQTINMKDHNEFVSRVNAEWEPVEFDITQFHLIAHLDGKDQFEVIRSFDLPTTTTTSAPAAAAAAASATGAPAAASSASKNDDAAGGDEALATILEPPKWGSRLLKPYVPPDALEKWMAKVNVAKYARDAPTHISQLGGMYHVDSSLLDAFLRKWRESYLSREYTPGYIEEIRGAPFRLYIDLDFDLATEEPTPARYALDLIREIAILVARVFGAGGAAVDPTALVFECHGSASKKFADGSVPGPAANDEQDDDSDLLRRYKSGYRVYFQRVFLDGSGSLDKLLAAVSNYLRRKAWPLPENAVRGVTWAEVVDNKSVEWDRGRLLGTIKRRKNLKRIYELAAVVDVRGTNEVLAKEFRASVLRQLYGSTLRLWDTLPGPDMEAGGIPVCMDNEFQMGRVFRWGPEAEAAAATAHEQK